MKNRSWLRRPTLFRVEELDARINPAAAFALSGTNLLTFDTASPTIVQTLPITGVAAGESLVGIDVRPQNGYLYALGIDATANTGTLYAVSSRTGSVSAIGAAGSVNFTTDGVTAVDLPDPATVGYGFDFNPAADRIRVVAGSLNFRINPNTGGGVDGDNTGLTSGAVTGTNPDGPTAVGTTTVDAAAYTNNQPNNGNITTLYTLDAASNALYIQNPANAGTQTLAAAVTLGGNPLDFTGINGFDISAGVNASASGLPVATGLGFAVLNVGGTNGLYTLNLVNGLATLIGNVGSGSIPVQGFAVASDLGGLPAIAMNSAGDTLLRFNTSTPGTVTSIAINTANLVAGETLVGIDLRPATGQLYALGISDASETGTLYLLDPQTGALSVAVGGSSGMIAFTGVDYPTGATYGFDFNPDVDRIRVTSSTGLNFRINQNTGLPVDGDTVAAGTQPDGSINGLAGGSTGVGGAAYTNSFGNDTAVTATTLYTLDAGQDAIFIQNPANSGTQTNGRFVTNFGTPIDFTDVNGFDIPASTRVATSGSLADGSGYAALVVGGVTGLYRINLVTGFATNLGGIGAGSTPITGFTVGDSALNTVSFANATYSDAENSAGVAVTLTRSGSFDSAATVTVNVTGGTASSGADFTAGPYTATFQPGSGIASFTLSFADDTIFEGNETIVLTLAGTDGNSVISTPNTATVTITENDPQQTFSVARAAGYALVGGNALIPINTVSGATAAAIPLSGINPGETLVAIDFRPQNGLLYGLGVNATANTGTLYVLSPLGGFAGIVGNAGSIAFTDGGGNPVDLPDSDYDIDFNPAVDRLRVVAGSLNFRVNPNDGTPIDGNLGSGTPAGINTDGPINGGTTTVTGTAYTNNFPNNGGVTTQYTLDAASNTLYIQNPPNAGTQTTAIPVTFSGSPFDFTAVRGFDILADVNAPSSNAAASGVGYAALTYFSSDVFVTALFRINLTTGAAVLFGSVPDNPASIAYQSDLGAIPAITLSADGTQIHRAIGTASPFIVNLTGIASGETIVGIDFRPQTGQLMGLGINATLNTGTLYRIDPQSGAAIAIGVPGQIAFTDASSNPVDLPDPATVGYGFDFNPTVDRIRVVSSNGLNFRINPITGAPVDSDANALNGITTDPAINGGGSAGVSAAAYTNSYAQSLTGGVTTLYTLDAAQDKLFIQNPANAGAQTNGIAVTLNGNPLDFTAVNGFDISANVRVLTSNVVAGGVGYATLTVNGTTGLYSINLQTGAAAVVSNTAGSRNGLALAQTPFLTNREFAFSGDDVSSATLRNPDNSTRYSLSNPFVSAPGGVRVATADFNNDGVNDLVVGTGPGVPARVRILDGVSQTELFATTPFGDIFNGGVFVAAGDINGDGIADLAISAGERGGPRVRVFDGKGFTQLADFFSVGGREFRGGVRVAIGDITADGRGDLIAAAGTSGGPRTAIYDGAALSAGLVTTFADFFSFETSLRNGSYVAAGDVDGDGFADLIAGAGSGGAPRVRIFSGRSLAGNVQNVISDFFAGSTTNRDGARVAAHNLDTDGRADVLVGAEGRIRAYAGSTLVPGPVSTTLFDFEAVAGGVYVG